MAALQRVTVALTIASCLVSLCAAQTPPASSTTSGTDTESALTLAINPWVRGRTYAPVTVPTGTTLQFIWPGAHGVYLLDSTQCPQTFAPGPNALYNVSSANSMNNNYTTTVTSPGVYYFACQVMGHCQSGQLQVVSVFDPAPGNLTGLATVAVSSS